MAFRNRTFLYDLRTTITARSTSGMKQDFVLKVAGVVFCRGGAVGTIQGVVVLHVASLLSELPTTLQCHFSLFSSQ
jgi:hypothetical protein